MNSGTLCSDILAIRCIDKFVCIGIGNFLHIYEIKNKYFVTKLKVFENNNIHGIVKGQTDDLFIYGGKNLSICKLKISEKNVELNRCSLKHFNDWIITLGWSQINNTTFLSILFAHNNLCFYNIEKDKVEILWCQEKCILYGGSLLPESDGNTIVFSGTVFQEILIWQAKNGMEYASDVAILHRLKGHKGVIFSVNFYPSLKVLTSTSDDRTVRLWSVRNKNTVELNEDTAVCWKNCHIELTTTMYGHTARVWRSIVRGDKILTIGEDSYLCTWSLDGKLLDKMQVHNGAEIWSIDVSEAAEPDCIITGGADGAVNILDFGKKSTFQVDLVYSDSDKDRAPKFVFYSKSGRILFFMDGGHLNSYDPHSKNFEMNLQLPRYSNYCVMQISPGRDKICLASKDGYVNTYKEFHDGENFQLSPISEIKISKLKIFAIHWLSNERIIACCDSGELKIIEEMGQNFEIISTFILPKSRERWTTAAITRENSLICGDRAGNVYVYYGLKNSASNRLPIQTFPKIHGKLGVQSFCIVDDGKRLLSTGRDGTVRYYELEDEKEEIRRLHFNKMPMDWVSQVLQANDDVYIVGFREIELIVYSTNLRRIVQRYDCGGGHRSWDCKIFNKSMNFTYIREKKIYQSSAELLNTSSPILNGFHTKEIHCVHFLKTSSQQDIFISASEDCTLRLSSSSSCVVGEKSKFQNVALRTIDSYDGHISSVKSLAVLNFEENEKLTKNLIFSGGGRAQLKIWEIKVSTEGGAALTKNDVACKELYTYMLRGTDLDRKKNCHNEAEAASFEDPEARFMDIKAEFHQENKNLVLIFVACSDGFLRVFLYDIIDNYLYTCPFVNYCNRCTLRVGTFHFENEIILMSMSTDGVVRFWRTRDAVENLLSKQRSGDRCGENFEIKNTPFSEMKLHQSGINTFDFRTIDDSTFLLLTGGDDNLLSLVVIRISMKNNLLFTSKLATWNTSSIHSAQITGTTFFDENRIISAGIDQSVVIFFYHYSNKLLTVSKKEEILTFVPDVQGLALNVTRVGKDKILACVYGKGIEIIVVDIS